MGAETDGTREVLLRTLRAARGETGLRSDDGVGRLFLVIDVGRAFGYVLRGRGSPTDFLGTVAGGSEEFGIERRESGEPGSDRGRGVPRLLLLAGAVLGLTYLLRSRSESVDGVVGTAADRARTVADETAKRSGMLAQRTEAASESVASRIERGGEEAAEQIREGGTEAADEIQKGGEQAEERIDEAAETAAGKAEEAADGTGDAGDEESEE